MARALEIGFFDRDKSFVVEELMPEARIQQVKRRMLHAAVVPIDGEPVVERFRRSDRRLARRIGVADKYHEDPAQFGIVSVSRSAGPPQAGHVVFTQSVNRKRRFLSRSAR